jgi:P4 family phage/plasmid primase-like protien
MLYGTGRNGKGRYVITLEHILGKTNCSHVALEELDGAHRFSIANLYGKLINVCSEPSTEKVLSTELLKKLTGEDTVDGEKKNIQKPITFQNTAKFVIMGNQYPQIRDATIGFWERILLLSWEKQFLEGDPATIPNIEKTWLENEDELSGILNWMIDGLTRLLTNKTFTKNKKMSELIVEFRKLSDPVGAFIAEKISIDLSQRTYFTKLYDCYKEYSNNLGFMPVTKQKFYNRIELIPKVRRDNDEKGNFWVGIVIKEEEEEDEAEENEENEENRGLKKYGGEGGFIDSQNSSFISFSSGKKKTRAEDVSLTTLERFEVYVKTMKEVGILLVKQELNLTEEQIQGCMASTKKAKWGINLQTIVYDDEEEE